MSQNTGFHYSHRLSIGDGIEEVLRVSRLSDILVSYADEQEALQALIAHKPA